MRVLETAYQQNCAAHKGDGHLASVRNAVGRSVTPCLCKDGIQCHTNVSAILQVERAPGAAAAHCVRIHKVNMRLLYVLLLLLLQRADCIHSVKSSACERLYDTSRSFSQKTSLTVVRAGTPRQHFFQ